MMRNYFYLFFLLMLFSMPSYAQYSLPNRSAKSGNIIESHPNQQQTRSAVNNKETAPPRVHAPASPVHESERPSVGGTWKNLEFGELSEIIDDTRVYVFSNDLKSREEMVKELRKYPRLEIVSRVEDCDFALVNAAGGYSSVSGYRGSINEIYTSTGEVAAIKAGSVDEHGLTHQRIVWSTKKSAVFRWDGDPGKQGVKSFIKALKKLRGEK